MKKFLPGILAIVMAFGLFAFTHAPAKKKDSTSFRYTGPSGEEADYTNAAYWSKSLTSCGLSGETVCVATPENEDITEPAQMAAEILLNDFDNVNIDSHRQ